MPSDMVRLYDIDTRRVTTIPAAELAPGMLRVSIVGIAGEVWIVAKALSQGEYRHPPFGEEGKELMRELSATFAEVRPLTAEEWEDGFRRDVNIDIEIAAWLAMATAYRHFTEGTPQGLDRKREIFQLILACVNNTPKRALQTAGLRTLARPLARRIVAYMEREGWKD